MHLDGLECLPGACISGQGVMEAKSCGGQDRVRVTRAVCTLSEAATMEDIDRLGSDAVGRCGLGDVLYAVARALSVEYFDNAQSMAREQRKEREERRQGEGQ